MDAPRILGEWTPYGGAIRFFIGPTPMQPSFHAVYDGTNQRLTCHVGLGERDVTWDVALDRTPLLAKTTLELCGECLNVQVPLVDATQCAHDIRERTGFDLRAGMRCRQLTRGSGGPVSVRCAACDSLLVDGWKGELRQLPRVAAHYLADVSCACENGNCTWDALRDVRKRPRHEPARPFCFYSRDWTLFQRVDLRRDAVEAGDSTASSTLVYKGPAADAAWLCGVRPRSRRGRRPQGTRPEQHWRLAQCAGCQSSVGSIQVSSDELPPELVGASRVQATGKGSYHWFDDDLTAFTTAGAHVQLLHWKVHITPRADGAALTGGGAIGAAILSAVEEDGIGTFLVAAPGARAMELRIVSTFCRIACVATGSGKDAHADWRDTVKLTYATVDDVEDPPDKSVVLRVLPEDLANMAEELQSTHGMLPGPLSTFNGRPVGHLTVNPFL